MKRLILLGALVLIGSYAPLARGQASHAGHVDAQAPAYRWPAVDMDRDGVYDRIDRCVSTRQGCSVDRYGCHLDADGDGVCDELDRCAGTPRGKKVDATGCHQGAAVPVPAGMGGTTEPVAAPVSEAELQLLEAGHIRLENVFFETGSAKLLPESEEALREVGGLLEKYPDLGIEVQGHTDSRGGSGYNRRLSQARAEAVRGFLLTHFQIKPEKLFAKGYGETLRETDERNEEERLRNRRVVLSVLNPEVLPRVSTHGR